jgi:hypothetical protein
VLSTINQAGKEALGRDDVNVAYEAVNPGLLDQLASKGDLELFLEIKKVRREVFIRRWTNGRILNW